MSTRSFKDLFEEAARHPAFHKELAILEFTEELWRVMQQKGVSGTELGRRIGSSQAYISRVLNGGANFTLGTMTKLAAGLGVELKMHLAPAGSVTVWRDYHATGSAMSDAGGRVIEVAFSDTSVAEARFARESATPRLATTIAVEEGIDGAATSAA